LVKCECFIPLKENIFHAGEKNVFFRGFEFGKT